MNDRQKLEAFMRLSALTGSAMGHILTDERSLSDVTVLLEVMQAFKEGKFAAFIQASKSSPVKDNMEVFDLEVCNVPFSRNDRYYLAYRRIRYVGELYYVYFDPRGAHGRETSERRMMKVLADRFGLHSHIDPIGLGWQPSYWSDPTFMAEINTLILERRPTPAAPDWEVEIPNMGRQRRSPREQCAYRGLARRLHHDDIHYVGEVFKCGRLQHCPEDMRSTGDFERIKTILHEVGSRLWAGALLPRNWSPPNWHGELWEIEIAAIAREVNEIETMQMRRDHQVREVISHPSIGAGKTLFDIEVLSRSIYACELRVRTETCLDSAGIKTVDQLVFKTERDLLTIRNFGRYSLNDVKSMLESFGLRLGMTEADFDTTTKDT